MRHRSGSLLPLLLALTIGLSIGALDFVSTDFRLALVLAAVGGGLLGYLFPQRRWRNALLLGLFVPIAIIFGMATRHRPARGHFVFIDARAVIPALIGASVGGWLRDKRHSNKTPTESTT